MSLKNSFNEGKHAQHLQTPSFLCYWFLFHLLFTGKDLSVKKKEAFSSKLFAELTQQFNFFAGYFLASLLFIANFFLIFHLKSLFA